VQRIADVRQSCDPFSFPRIGTAAHPVRPDSYIEINNFYTATVYEKGAELIRMIETIIGRDTFRRGMDLYFERHDGEAATVEDFIACFEEASGRDLGPEGADRALFTEDGKAVPGGAPADDRAGILADALAAVLADADSDPAFAAQALTLPSEADIARELGADVDPDAVLAARRALRLAVRSRLDAALSDALARFATPGPYTPDAASAGRRALCNVALDLWASGGEADRLGTVAARHRDADNMTDRFAALAVLAQHPGTDREAALAAFRERYRTDALILDKWLALQAAIPEAGTLDRVKALLADPAFAMTNPNRLRALVGSFASGNQTQFNRADGAGYAFLAEVVVATDPRNPQVAARLLSAFRSWRALEPGRRARAREALERVAATATLSADVRDIVARSLG
jgi:aminopeptidase N